MIVVNSLVEDMSNTLFEELVLVVLRMILAIDANLDALSEEIRCKFVLLIFQMIQYGLFISFYLSASNAEGC